MASKNAPAVRAETGVVQYDYGEHAAAGFENQTQNDLTVPFLDILQPLSPQVEEDGIPGAKPGMIFNTVTDDLFAADTGVVFVPVLTARMFVEWIPRKQGGGMVGRHQPGDEVVKRAIEQNAERGDKFGKYYTYDENGEPDNELVETFYVYGIAFPDADTMDGDEVVIAFRSTKIKPYKAWMSKIHKFKGRTPLWAHAARLTTVKQSNDQGSYFNFVAQPLNGTVKESLLDPNNDPRFKAGAELYELLKVGSVRMSDEDGAGDSAPGDVNATTPPF